MTATSTAVSSTIRFTSITPNLLVRDIVAAPPSTATCSASREADVPDHAPFVFVWLERDGMPVFLNDR